MQEKESLCNENESFIASCLFYKLKTLTDNLLIYDKIEVRKTRAIFHIIWIKIILESLLLENEHSLMKSYFLKW